jgi:hypothetical protein
MQESGKLVGSGPSIGSDAPVICEFFVLKQADYSMAVSDINGKKHGYNLQFEITNYELWIILLSLKKQADINANVALHEKKSYPST